MRLGITGIARSGKDTAAKMAGEQMTRHPIVSLAGPIKDVFDKVMGWDERHRDGELKEVRQAATLFAPILLVKATREQYLVSHALAVHAVDCFLQVLEQKGCILTEYATMTRIENLSPRIAYQVWGSDVWRELGGEDFWIKQLPLNCIVSDVRYDNEAAVCDKAIEIIRPDNGVVAEAHQSEAGLSEAVARKVIMNDGTLDDLQGKVNDYIYCECQDNPWY